jgi:hypothetical protein
MKQILLEHQVIRPLGKLRSNLITYLVDRHQEEKEQQLQKKLELDATSPKHGKHRGYQRENQLPICTPQ